MQPQGLFLPDRTIWHQRHTVVQTLRAQFDAWQFIEVDTAVAVCAPAPEPYVDAPEVWLSNGTTILQRFLQTSPELPMKRLLAQGLTLIYQIAAVFRDGDNSPVHRPEFRLLEWYRAHAPYTHIMEDCQTLLRVTAQAVGIGDTLHWQGRTIDLKEPFTRLSVDTAFQRYVGFSILDNLSIPRLQAALQQVGIGYAKDDSWSDLFNRAFVGRIEPMLAHHPTPIFLTDYPAPLAALARLNPHDPRCAERFELYVAGVELANGFGELTCAQTQRSRFVQDKALRQQLGKRDYPLDEHFLNALPHMPAASGVAMGLERLLMLLLNASNIDNIAFLAWSTT